MKSAHVLLSIVIVSMCISAAAQQTLNIPLNIQQAYTNQTRSQSGVPGKKYWQNTAQYNIDVNFSPKRRIVSGTEEIVYSNNSPDTLNQIWFKLYPNFYQKGSQRDEVIKAADVGEGVRIEKMLMNNKQQTTDELHIEGTNMTVNIASLLPGKQITFNITFSYILNKTSHVRTGMVDDSSAFVAYFFPRIAVYDDIDGWNKYPYTGSYEFYNDFCNFKVAVTVPKNYLVWGTGTLQNCNEVLNEKFCMRLSEAEKTDAVTNIIDTADILQNNITTDHATNTFQYEATNVTDFVFAVSNHYIWQSSSLVVDKSNGRRTRVDAVFNPAHADYFNVINYARETVKDMSYTFPSWPYPYPHETVFDGLDQMEYPMMVNDNPLEEKADEIELTDHEIFHTMFPFYMGTNETKYGWMDEGWATIAEWLISPMIDSSVKDNYGVAPYENAAGKEVDLPIITLTTEMNNTSFYINSYPKPAFGYLYVKDLLGDALFTKALHYYIEQWHGRHPMPYDFFNCMNTSSGENLNWFWKRWFFDDGVPDLAISKVTNNGNAYQATIALKGTKPVPIDLDIYFSDNTIQAIHKNISCWQNGNTTTVLSFTANKKIKKLVLGSLYVPDVNKKDNVYIFH